MTTDIVPGASHDLRRLVESGEIDLNTLMDRLAAQKEAPEPPTAPEPTRSTAVVLSADDKRTLRELPAKLARMELPDHPRELSLAERQQLVPLFDQVKIAKAAVAKAELALRDAMHDHIDAVTDGPLGKNGHKLTEGEVVSPQYAKKVVRGLTGGSAVSLTDADLQRLVDDKVISLAQYRRMTHATTTRQIVPDAVMAEVKKDPSLVDVFAKLARREDLGTQIRMAKN